MKKLLGLLLFLALFALGVYQTLLAKRADNNLYIALAVSSLPGQSPYEKGHYLRGASLWVEEINQRGGVHGRKLVLDIYDDSGDPHKARAKALEIIEDGRAVAVIGHPHSATSVSAGAIYKKYGIPALTPTATGVEVTQDNDWYFRVMYNNRLQARSMANYIKNVLRYRNVAVFQHKQEYGNVLANTFVEAAQEVGLKVSQRHVFDANAAHLEAALRPLAQAMVNAPDVDMVLLAMHAPEAVETVRQLRDAGSSAQFIGPDAIATANFAHGFKAFPQERKQPGYYSDGVYVAAPLIFDTAGERALSFKESYLERYGDSPTWESVFAYEAALLLTEALKQSSLKPTKPFDLTSLRYEVRDFLANLSSPEQAVEGATGLNYFDEHGDAQRPIAIGIYQHYNIISTLTQLQSIRKLEEVPNLQAALKDGTVLQVDGKYMYKTTVVYSGIELNKISQFNPSDLSYGLDFHIWFRFHDELRPEAVEFYNALEPIDLGEPIQSRTEGDIYYKLYRAQGRFKGNLQKSSASLRTAIIGLQFGHRQLSRNNLIYVTDVLGMGLTNGNDFGHERYGHVLGLDSGWRISALPRFFQDNLLKSTLGNPTYLHSANAIQSYSRFNLELELEQVSFSLRGLLPYELALSLLLVCVPVLLTLWLVGYRVVPSRRLLWLLYFGFGLTLLLALEVVAVRNLASLLHYQHMLMVTTGFHLLWWIAPAVLLSLGVEYFVWIPLESGAGQRVPTIVRRFVRFFIYLLAFFGIVAFVYDQKLTSLLATSGVVAMIIGLAIQINISNIFSGIALNLERPFVVGDWIRIGDLEEGRVTDINWRSTRVLTRGLNLLVVPNSSVAESVLSNYCAPDARYRTLCKVFVDPSHNPERVQKILMDALLSTDDEVQKQPPPLIFFVEANEWAAEYRVLYIATDYPRRFATQSHVWERVWNHLHYAGIPVARKQEHYLYPTPGADSKHSPTYHLLLQTDLLQALPETALEHLSRSLRPRQFKAGETIVFEGDDGNSLFIIAEGVVSVQKAQDEHGGKSLEVARLSVGAHFGEMALLTGSQRNASVVAVTACGVYEITKDHIAPLLAEEPGLLRRLSQILAERERATQHKLDALNAGKQRLQDKDPLVASLLRKIMLFFEA